jgi:hypothetical protein
MCQARYVGDAEKAVAYERFAKEFAESPPDEEPSRGWAGEMAYLCRRLAMRSRGEDPGEWVPEHVRTQTRH